VHLPTVLLLLMKQNDHSRSDGRGAGRQSGERLSKFLARYGLGSRRRIDQWIAAGRIRVNGKPAVLGIRIHAGDRIEIDGRPFRQRDMATERPPKLAVLNKPVGVVCTRRDPQHRPVVFDLLPPLSCGRWISVGRLDINTEGLMLFTDSGELAHYFMHPSNQLEREYLARVYGRFDHRTVAALVNSGAVLDGKVARLSFCRIQGGQGANRWLRLGITEGRQREVRRLLGACGLQVSRLKRIRFGPVALPETLAPGQVQVLSPSQITRLLGTCLKIDSGGAGWPGLLTSDRCEGA